MRDFIERLRSLPLPQRYLILWGGSFVIFLLVFWLWLFQVKSKLAYLNASSLAQLPTSSPAQIFKENVGGQDYQQPSNQSQRLRAKNESGEGQSQIGTILKFIKNGSASLFSLFSGFQSKEQESLLIREGDELDEFLKYQPFPEE